MVAIFGLELIQLPGYGATKGTGTGAGEGGVLNVPVAVNWTCPCGKAWASALVGLTSTD